jgi:hypothetical protein
MQKFLTKVQCNYSHGLYRVFRVPADWKFILPSKLPAKELHHLPRKMPPHGTMYSEALWMSDKPA